MSKYDPPIFFNKEQFNTEKANNIREAEVYALQEQNKYLKELAETASQAAKTAEEAAQSSEKSSKHSKICTIISVVIAGLMFAATVIEIVINFLDYYKT